ncbi:hypothetical protein R6Q59_031246 [Mikania micrantha]
MAMAWRAHRAMLRAHLKEIGGSKYPTKAKATPPYNISKEDWEYLCDMWCGATFLETAKQKVEDHRNRKMDTRNGSKSTIRYQLENEHDLYSSSGQIDTWSLTHWDEEKDWISKEAAATYVLGRSSFCLHGWERDPSICSNTTCINQFFKLPTYNELVDEVETLKETCAIMEKILIEKNLMSPLPGPFQDDTSQSDENDDERVTFSIFYNL